MAPSNCTIWSFLLEPAHVGGPFGLGPGDLGGITDDEGSILGEHPQERFFKGGPLQEAVDHFLAGEEPLGEGSSDLGDPGGVGPKDPLDDHGRLPCLVFPGEKKGGKLSKHLQICDRHLHHPLWSSWPQGVSHLMSQAQLK